MKTIKHRKFFKTDKHDRVDIILDRLLLCCHKPGRRTNLILGGAEEVRKELDFHNFLSISKRFKALIRRQVRTEAEFKLLNEA